MVGNTLATALSFPEAAATSLIGKVLRRQLKDEAIKRAGEEVQA